MREDQVLGRSSAPPLRRATWAWLAFLVPAVSVGEVALALAVFAACDVGINASANSFAALYLYFPVALVVNSVLVLITVLLARRLGAGSGGIAVSALVVVLLAGLFLWVTAMTPAYYPDPICPGNVPPWWPTWLPS